MMWTRVCFAADAVDPTADGAAEPAMKVLRDNWVQRVDNLKGRPFVTQRTTILKELLDQQPTNVINAAIARVCQKEVRLASGAATSSEEAYDAALLAALVDRAVDKRDRMTLVKLLRHNCPRVVEQLMPPEFYFAKQWPGSISCLFEAYDTAAAASAKKDLLACLERAFASIRARSPNESDFIREAGEWYAKKQPELKINEQYPWLPARSADPGSSPRDLFLPNK
jgi:hypothetical protein